MSSSRGRASLDRSRGSLGVVAAALLPLSVVAVKTETPERVNAPDDRGLGRRQKTNNLINQLLRQLIN